MQVKIEEQKRDSDPNPPNANDYYTSHNLNLTNLQALAKPYVLANEIIEYMEAGLKSFKAIVASLK